MPFTIFVTAAALTASPVSASNVIGPVTPSTETALIVTTVSTETSFKTDKTLLSILTSDGSETTQP